MKKLLSLILLIFSFTASYADGEDPDLFSDAGIAEKFATADSIAISYTDSAMPGRMPTLLFTSIVSAIGTYTLYGAGAGPIAVAIVYACKHGDRREVKLAIFGCLTGAAVGGLIKWLSVK
ncbi:MAG: hypothetical protein J5826_06115 [Bacteroidales bacterium]|nr:hypothetical protein [Bacteroidales bacterium]